MNSWKAQLGGMLAIAAAVAVAFGIAEGIGSALLAGAWMLGIVAIIHLLRDRSDAVRTVSGVGDERTRELYMRAVAFAGTVMSFVIPGWWLVTVASGETSEILTVLSALFGASFLGAAVYLSRRG